MLKVFVINTLIVSLVVGIHYEVLYRSTSWLPKLPVRPRFRTLFGVVVAMLAHVIEVWVFALAYYQMDKQPGWGTLDGSYDGSLYSSVYFSFATFTTLGMGDIVPLGDIRFLVALESLAGFVLITWTASFLYLEMTRNWTSSDGQDSLRKASQDNAQDNAQDKTA
ncbi:MAG: potassium channel family protein [Congregibacter sp.]